MSGSSGAAMAAMAMRAGNMVAPSATGGVQYGELSATSKAEQLRHAALLKRVDAEKRARRIVVPTSDIEVRALLRRLGNPVRLFGESAADVRERLRELLARIEIEGDEQEDLVSALLSQGGGSEQPKKQAAEAEEVYEAASSALVAARRSVATYSFERAAKRLRGQRELVQSEVATQAREAHAASLYLSLRNLALSQSQYADERPVSRVRCCPKGATIATGAWSGRCATWDSETCLKVANLDSGSDDRVTGLAWHPEGNVIAAGSADKSCYLWRVPCGEKKDDDDENEGHLAEKSYATTHRFEGHGDRLGNVDFHPSGSYLGTASFDHTWRLWDVETGTQLLLQDGHAREVYAISFQTDGSLCFTGDFVGVGLLWDLRSGKQIHACLGHSKKILAADFAPDGYQIATAGDDNVVRFWDLRTRKCHYVLPAHSHLVSDCKFSPDYGEAIATASFDGSVALWSTRDFTNLSLLQAHDGKAMSLDFARHKTRDRHSLVTAGFDRTFKLWIPENDDDDEDSSSSSSRDGGGDEHN